MRITASFLIAAFCAAPAMALNYMGPPDSDITAGQFGLGAEMSQGSVDLEISGYGLSSMADFDINSYYSALLFGISDHAELTARLGISDIEEDAAGGFDSGSHFAWGLGVKSRIAGDDRLAAGVLFQLASLYGDDSAYAGPDLIDVDFDAYEIQIAAGIRYRTGGLSIYGGPFVHLVTGTLDAAVGAAEISLDVEQASELGGYAGISLELAENTDLSIEYQFTDDADLIGLGLMHRFGQKKPGPKTRARRENARPVKGYKATIDPATGRPVTTPVYE